MKLYPGTPVAWLDHSGTTRYGTVLKKCDLGYSVLIDGGRRHLVPSEIIVIDHGD